MNDNGRNAARGNVKDRDRVKYGQNGTNNETSGTPNKINIVCVCVCVQKKLPRDAGCDLPVRNDRSPSITAPPRRKVNCSFGSKMS